MANPSHLSKDSLIYNRRPEKEDASDFGLVQYFRSDFQAWYFGYWDNKQSRHDGWAHCINHKSRRGTH